MFSLDKNNPIQTSCFVRTGPFYTQRRTNMLHNNIYILSIRQGFVNNFLKSAPARAESADPGPRQKNGPGESNLSQEFSSRSRRVKTARVANPSSLIPCDLIRLQSSGVKSFASPADILTGVAKTVVVFQGDNNCLIIDRNAVQAIIGAFIIGSHPP